MQNIFVGKFNKSNTKTRKCEITNSYERSYWKSSALSWQFLCSKVDGNIPLKKQPFQKQQSN